MMETQQIEWKENWRDEYLKWICGFANAYGGKLYIGKDDEGRVKGISDAKKLMEDIPNKVRDILGILVDVHLYQENGFDYLEIVVEAYPYPISYKGQYHYRSGSTKQELKGASLDKFLLQKQGRRWDGVPVPKVIVHELSDSAFTYFRKNAARTTRLSVEVLQETNAALLDKLHLIEGAYLKRAAILLFHPDPEQYFTGAYIKIGYFKTDDDLLYQDEIHGYLFEQVEKTMDLLLTKYLKAIISYQGIHRVEQYPIPEPALREALLNAIAHKDYSSGNPIQISVYENKLIIWNEGLLPDSWTVERLVEKHPSKPFNPDVSTAFFRAGLIELWGRGTLTILRECAISRLVTPIFHYDFGGFWVEFQYNEDSPKEKTSGKMTENVKEKVKEKMRENELITTQELANYVSVSLSTIERAIRQLKKEGQIERIGGDNGGLWKVLSGEA